MAYEMPIHTIGTQQYHILVMLVNMLAFHTTRLVRHGFPKHLGLLGRLKLNKMRSHMTLQ